MASQQVIDPSQLDRPTSSSGNVLIVLPKQSDSIVCAVFGLGGVAISAFSIFSPGTSGPGLLLGFIFLILSLIIGVFGFVGAIGIERAASIQLSRDGVCTYSMCSREFLWWSDVTRFGIEEDDDSEMPSYDVVAYHFADEKFAIFPSLFYASTSKVNAISLNDWLERIRRCDADSRDDAIAAAPDFLRIKGRDSGFWSA